MSTGFSFGAKTTAPPAFGTGSITFGTPATTTQNQPNFGFTAAPNSQSTTGLQFGTPTATTSAPNLFGTPTSNFKPGGFGTAAPTGGLFGTATTTAAPPGFNFGTSSTAPAGNVGLPLGAAGTTVAPATGLFGTPTASIASTFGAPTATTTGLFGSSTAGGIGTTLFAPASTAASGFLPNTSILGKTPTSVTGANALTFGTGISTATTGLTLGLGGTTTTTTASNFNIVSAPPVVGLGGQASSQIKTGAAVSTQKEVPPKEQPLPNEILQTVEQFKEMVKKQKLYSSDIARCSIRDFKKVEQEIDLLSNLLNEVENQLQKNRYIAEKLKYDTAKSLQNVEMAQRTQDTPPGLQYENSAPLKFFLDLADQFEREMQALKIQIEAADKYVKNHKNPDILTPQDLSLGMRRLHETFVALAGRLQTVHNQVETQKESYLNIRRHLLNDPTNPFEKNRFVEMNVGNIGNAAIYSPPKVATGPTPFDHMPFFSGNLLMQQQNQSTYVGGTAGSATSSGFGSSLGFRTGTQQPSTTLFGQNTFGNTSTNFQLQKPPAGYKRGKQ